MFVILNEQEWIESGEAVSDDLLLDLGVQETSPVLLEVRLVWHRRFGDIVFFERTMIPANAIAGNARRVEIGASRRLLQKVRGKISPSAILGALLGKELQ